MQLQSENILYFTNRLNLHGIQFSYGKYVMLFHIDRLTTFRLRINLEKTTSETQYFVVQLNMV